MFLFRMRDFSLTRPTRLFYSRAKEKPSGCVFDPPADYFGLSRVPFSKIPFLGKAILKETDPLPDRSLGRDRFLNRQKTPPPSPCGCLQHELRSSQFHRR
jgi:hypothetical protein